MAKYYNRTCEQCGEPHTPCVKDADGLMVCKCCREESKYRVLYKGEVCVIQKIRVYCKAGAYKHEYRDGWGLVNNDGEVLLGGEADRTSNNPTWGAARYEQPGFRTRKSVFEVLTYKGATALNEKTKAMMEKYDCEKGVM